MIFAIFSLKWSTSSLIGAYFLKRSYKCLKSLAAANVYLKFAYYLVGLVVARG
jgi:hypothetical protein